MVRQLQDGMMVRVADNGAISEAFAVTDEVKQGCVFVPTLFSLTSSAMLVDAYRNERPEIRIAHKTDANLLKSRRMRIPTRPSTTTFHHLLFADDCALNTTTKEDRQRSMDLLAIGYSEDLTEASADQPGQLGRPRPRPTDVEEDSEDRRSDLRGKPHCRRESKTLGSQISTAPTSQRQHPTASNVSTVPADIPGTNWTCERPSDQLQPSDCTNRRLSFHLSLNYRDVNKLRRPSRTTTIILLLHCFKVCRWGGCNAHQCYTQS
nr:unnamed protein product [Spirometra erinaceieuropaei]